MPIARPTMFASASGVFQQRSDPNSLCSPTVSLNTPPLPLISPARSASSRVASATSSPNTTTRSSLRISSFRQWLISSAIVRSLASAVFALSVKYRASVGFNSSEYWCRRIASRATLGSTACIARSAARCTSSSTFCSSRLILSSSRIPSRSSHSCIFASGSRALSACTSSSLRYCRSSSLSEWL